MPREGKIEHSCKCWLDYKNVSLVTFSIFLQTRTVISRRSANKNKHTKSVKTTAKDSRIEVVHGLMNISLPSYVMNRDTDGDTEDPPAPMRTITLVHLRDNKVLFLRWLLRVALRIPTAHKFCVISASVNKRVHVHNERNIFHFFSVIYPIHNTCNGQAKLDGR